MKRTPIIRVWRSLIFAILIAMMVIWGGCKSSPGQADDIKTDVISDGTAGSDTRDTMDKTQCNNCHDYSQLAEKKSTEAPREWTAKSGQGLTRKITLNFAADIAFSYRFPRRGNHTIETAGEPGCSTCHPMSTQGLRHGMSQYPLSTRSQLFTSQTDCGSACHDWLPASGTSVGYKPKEGTAPTYSGSLRPYELLTGANNRHAEIFKNGWVKVTGDPISIQRIKPGCGGCHTIIDERHGTMTECLDCHKFGGMSGAIHMAHLEAINQNRETIDPDHGTESSCNYCHGLNDSPTRLLNSACYNCHLSGHQPLDASGKVHFWPM
jgi:hypothetical protein